MKIIILGAGRVGQAVADSLVLERNDITVIDTDKERLRELESRYDLRGVLGNGTDPTVLAEAGAQDTELLIACASTDETNLVCCKVAQMVFNIPGRIARVRSNAWSTDSPLLGPEGFGVSCALRPEDSLTRYLSKLVEFPGALQVREFADNRALLASVRARANAPLVGKTIAEIRKEIPDLPMRIVAIYRRYADQPDQFIHSSGETRIEPDDEVFIVAAEENAAALLLLLTKPPQAPVPSVRRILIVDGGVVAIKLAQLLSQKRKGYYRIKIVERDEDVANALSAQLPEDVLMFRAEGTDESFLEEEAVEEMDLVLSLSDNDENNIMSCLLAKRMGAKRVLALINQRSYADLMHGTQIDIALTPAQAMLGELLTYVRQGDVQAVHSLRRGVAEALEIVVRGTEKTSRVIGKTVSELKLPRDVHIGLIARGLEEASDAAMGTAHSAPEDLGGSEVVLPHESDSKLPKPAEPNVEVIFPTSTTVIKANDHIVFFIPHKRLVRVVEKVFRITPTFF